MGMLPNRRIWTWYEGEWHEGNYPILGSADHATWLGPMVFDGARTFNGVSPDLDLHMDRINHSAVALGLQPTKSVGEMVALAEEGIGKFPEGSEIYIRPMYWSREGGMFAVDALPESTTFALCLEEAGMAPAGSSITMTTTSFRRPTLDVATVNAKAACLYPNNSRMLKEAQMKGFTNAIVCDAAGNVAETATSNIFLVKDGVVKTPIPNGTFLNGITRQRVIALLEEAGTQVEECVLTLADFKNADEVFTTGNFSKVTPVTRFDEREYEIGPVAERARELYWKWAGAA